MFAFYKDSALEHVEPFLPASVNSIGASAFNGCPVTNDLVLSCVGLKTLPAPGTRGAYLFGSIKSRVVDCSQSGLVTIGERAFSDATDITRLYLPRTLESIGPCAFYNVKTLQHVEPCLPAAITNIGGSAFAYCPITNDLVLSNVGLKSLPGPGTGTVGLFPSAQFPTIDCSRSGIASIGGSAFNGVSTLTNVFLPPDLMTIDGSVFQSCTSLREVSFQSCPTTVNSTAFRYAMGLPGRMTFPKGDEAWTAFIESAKTARTFKTWDEAKETERNAYLAEFPVRPKPLGYMVYGGVNRWFVPVNRSSFVLFLR